MISLSPVFNNINESSSAIMIKDVDLSTTVATIINLNEDESVKEEAEKVAKELDAASKAKDCSDFFSKLERLSTIAKNSVEVAKALGPFALTALQNFLN